MNLEREWETSCGYHTANFNWLVCCTWAFSLCHSHKHAHTFPLMHNHFPSHTNKSLTCIQAFCMPTLVLKGETQKVLPTKRKVCVFTCPVPRLLK